MHKLLTRQIRRSLGVEETQLAAVLADEVPIIAAGGVVDGAKAQAKLDAGAQLVQIYSGLVFHGPGLVKDCVAATRTSAHATAPR